jgi:hypothetical protein
MSLLTAAICIVGGLCALDLLLTLGVVRRLRTHTTALGELKRLQDTEPPSPLPAGSSVGGFTAATRDGGFVTAELLDRELLVGFFAPGCDGCAKLLPDFVESAPAIAGGPEHVLAVVTDAGDDADGVEEYVDKLRAVARIVVEGPEGPVAGAFAVTSVPALVLVGPGGTVVASGSRLSDLPVPVAG